jgi:hypothetical protein
MAVGRRQQDRPRCWRRRGAHTGLMASGCTHAYLQPRLAEDETRPEAYRCLNPTPRPLHERHFERDSDGFVYRLLIEYEPRGEIPGLFDRFPLARRIRGAIPPTLVVLGAEFLHFRRLPNRRTGGATSRDVGSLDPRVAARSLGGGSRSTTRRVHDPRWTTGRRRLARNRTPTPYSQSSMSSIAAVRSSWSSTVSGSYVIHEGAGRVKADVTGPGW